MRPNVVPRPFDAVLVLGWDAPVDDAAQALQRPGDQAGEVGSEGGQQVGEVAAKGVSRSARSVPGAAFQSPSM